MVSYLRNTLNCDITDMYPLGLHLAFLARSPTTRYLLSCMPFHRTPCHMKVEECSAVSLNARLHQRCPNLLREAQSCWREDHTGVINCSLASEMRNCFGNKLSSQLVCINNFEDTCSSDYKIRATKVHRLSMQAVEDVIRKIPDVYIVFYIRDPRGIWLSRVKAGRDLPISALCNQMLSDYKIYEQLHNKYPDVFIKVKYEDLAENPVETSQQIYHHFDEKLPQSVKQYMESITHSRHYAKEKPYSIIRLNSNKTANAWRIKMTKTQRLAAEKGCYEYLLRVGYKL